VQNNIGARIAAVPPDKRKCLTARGLFGPAINTKQYKADKPGHVTAAASGGDWERICAGV